MTYRGLQFIIICATRNGGEYFCNAALHTKHEFSYLKLENSCLISGSALPRLQLCYGHSTYLAAARSPRDSILSPDGSAPNSPKLARSRSSNAAPFGAAHRCKFDTNQTSVIDRSRAPAKSLPSWLLVDRCPATGLKVQGWRADEPPSENDRASYEAVICTACTRVRFVNRKTGRSIGDDEE